MKGPLSSIRDWKRLCKQFNTFLIADEIQCGFGRTGDFFAFQNMGLHQILFRWQKVWGMDFPIGGILIHPDIEASYGLLGTTFGGNHLACTAALTVLEVLKKENLMQHAKTMSEYFKAKSKRNTSD